MPSDIFVYAVQNNLFKVVLGQKGQLMAVCVSVVPLRPAQTVLMSTLV